MKKRKNPDRDPDFLARMYRPLTTFQKAFGYSLVFNVPEYPHRLSKPQVRQLEVVRRMLRENTIEATLLEWGRWNVAPVKSRHDTTPRDKVVLFRWLDDILGGVTCNGQTGNIEPTTVASFALMFTFVLRAFLAVNTHPARPRPTRATLERVNFEHVLADTAKSMPIALRRAEARWRKEVRRGTA